MHLIAKTKPEISKSLHMECCCQKMIFGIINSFCYEVTSCQAIYEITFLIVSTLNAWAEPQVQQSPALATLLFVDWLPTGQWSAVNLAVYFRESRYFYFVNIERSQMIRT